jgi:hypothetical protein
VAARRLERRSRSPSTRRHGLMSEAFVPRRSSCTGTCCALICERTLAAGP